MERRIRLISAVMMLCIGHAASAQDIDGISLWDKCTKEQLIEKYGQPVKYFSQEDNEVGLGMIEEIEFKDVSIRLEGNTVVEFGFDSTKPRAMTKFISGGIKIGDQEDVTKKLEKHFFKRTELKNGETRYKYLFKEFRDDSFTIVVKDGKIVYMYACARTT